MKHLRNVFPPTVKQRGASAGSILQGVSPNNKGLRLRVQDEQPRGQDGPIRGNFTILDVGDNKHAASLYALQGQTTNAQQVLAAIRVESAACVNVANTNLLIQETDGPEGMIPKR